MPAVKRPKIPPAAEWLAVSDLLPWIRNPRRPGTAIARVAESIKRFGFGAPVVARRLSDGRLEVVAGHTRVRALHTLLDADATFVARGCPAPGLLPVRIVDLSDAEARMLSLADNRLGEIAEWDEDLLAEILAFEHEDVRLWSGFTAQELDVLLAEPQQQTKPRGKKDKNAVTISVGVLRADEDAARRLISEALEAADIPHEVS